MRLCLFLIFICNSGFAISFRQDLLQVGVELCRQPADFSKWLQNHGIFDAGVVGTLYKNTQNLHAIVSKEAAKRNHLGAVWGRCPSGKGWSMTTPSPNTLPEVDLKNWCARSLWELAQDNREVRSIEPRSGSFEDGYTGVYCIRKKKENNGAVLWFLIPKGELDPIPLLVDSAAPSIVRWVNSQRRSLGLGNVSLITTRYLDTLFRPGVLTHDHQALVRANDIVRLKSKDIYIVGENRVSGHSDSWMQQMWMSPRHRELLLSPRAYMMAVYQTERFMMLVMLGKGRHA